MKNFHQMFLLCVTLAAVNCAAYAQNAYADCTTNFTLLENALLETSDNIFQLTTTYFHPDVEKPLYVDVYYNFSDYSPEAHYIWSAATLFFIVRPPALTYLTQFYSHLQDNRMTSLTLQLPADCADLVNDTRSNRENFLFVLTQRVNHVFLLY